MFGQALIFQTDKFKVSAFMSIDFQSSKKYEMDRDTPFSSCLLCLFVQKKEKIGGGYRSSIKVKNFFSRRLWSRVTFISFDFFIDFSYENWHMLLICALFVQLQNRASSGDAVIFVKKNGNDEPLFQRTTSIPNCA